MSRKRRIYTEALAVWLLLVLGGLAFWAGIIWLAVQLVKHL